MDGGSGIDTLVLSDLNALYDSIVDMTTGTVTYSPYSTDIDTFYNIENVFGTYADDIIIGNDENNNLNGWYGNDVGH